MFYLEVNSSLIPLLAFLGNLLDILHIALPIGLILFVSIDLVKAVVSQDNEQISKTVRSIKNRVIACLAIFLLPTFIESFFYKTFVTLQMDVDEYEDILKSYRSVINSEEIDIQDRSKEEDISGTLMYSIPNDISSSNVLEVEQKFSEYAKTLTKILFADDSPAILGAICHEDFTIYFKDKQYNFDQKISLSYQSSTLGTSSVDQSQIVSSVILSDVTILGEHYEKAEIQYFFVSKDNKWQLSKVSIQESGLISNYLTTAKEQEKPNEIVSGEKYTSTNQDYDYSKLDKLSSNQVEAIYQKNADSLVILNTISYSAVVNRASGFLIADGIVVTSWSYFQNSLMSGQAIVIKDLSGKTYKSSGIVASLPEKDLVVIKLNQEKSGSVVIADAKQLQKNDPVVAITSKTGTGFTMTTGIVSSSNDIILSVLPLEQHDWGSALFNQAGEVVGMNTSRMVTSELSSASTLEGLKTLQEELKKQNFQSIVAISLEEVKQQYYYRDQNQEEIVHSISDKIWNKYKKIGSVGDSIVLDLVKASYYEGVVSLRYENKTAPYLDTLSYADDFIANLISDGYQELMKNNEKIMYKKGATKVIIMEEFDYLIIVLVKESL